MRKTMLFLVSAALVLSACGSKAGQNSLRSPGPNLLSTLPAVNPPLEPSPSLSASLAPSLYAPTAATPVSTPSIETRSTPATTDIDPLTGLRVADSKLLDRRPLAVKVENLPRNHRPQWGLSQADLVYEYYTEQGTTRFIAIFYGKDAEQVAPIRSARFFDINIVQMYKAIFAFGSAYRAVLDRLDQSDFADRLVIEGGNNCPPMCRYEPNGANLLMTSTSQLSAYAARVRIDNTRQNLSGMTFDFQAPAGGQPASQVVYRYSGAIYNRWDFDAASGKYNRWVDKQDDLSRTHEVYVQLTDRANRQPITAENVVTLFIPHHYFAKTPETEVFEMAFTGSGPATLARDGQLYQARWQRSGPDSVVTLTDEHGAPLPFKPGTTWYEVLSSQSTVSSQSGAWRFTFVLP